MGRFLPEPIQARAKQVARELGIIGFNASNGWLQGWLSGYNIGKSVKLHDEAADINLPEAETKMNGLREKIRP